MRNNFWPHFFQRKIVLPSYPKLGMLSCGLALAEIPVMIGLGASTGNTMTWQVLRFLVFALPSVSFVLGALSFRTRTGALGTGVSFVQLSLISFGLLLSGLISSGGR